MNTDPNAAKSPFPPHPGGPPEPGQGEGTSSENLDTVCLNVVVVVVLFFSKKCPVWAA